MPHTQFLTIQPDAREGRFFFRRVRPVFFSVGRRSAEKNLMHLANDLRSGPWVGELQKAVAFFCKERDWLPLLTESGIWNESGFFSEISYRMLNKFLPRALHDRDATAVARYWLDESNDWAWIDRIPDENWIQIAKQIAPKNEDVKQAVTHHLFRAVNVLSLRLAGMALEGLLEKRLYEVPNALEDFMAQSQMAMGLKHGFSDLVALSKKWTACERHLQTIRTQTSQRGVSLGLTNRLERCHQILMRLRLLMKVIDRTLDHGDWAPTIVLFKEISRAENQRFDLFEYSRRNLEVLALQITQHASRTGEKYIAVSRTELTDMFMSAMIAGFVVSFMVIIKMLLIDLHLPIALEALSIGTNYAVGFVMIHVVGGTLATKQPAMTASTIAASIDQTHEQGDSMQAIARLIVRTLRTQFTALAGNVLMVVPMAILLNLALQRFGWHLSLPTKGESLVYSNHAFMSLSIFYAAIAGVCLFFSGVAAGWMTNWYVFNEISQRLRISPVLNRIFSAEALNSWVSKIDHEIAAWTGNIFLGYALGFVPIIGVIFGLPLDIRHVTFAAGAAAFGMTAYFSQASWPLILAVAFGVILLGLVNLAVSFSLALGLAMTSRAMPWSRTKDIILKSFKMSRE